MESLGLEASSACKSGGVTWLGAWDEEDEDTAARKEQAAEEAPAAPKEMEDEEEPAARKELEDDQKTVAPKDEDDGATTPTPRGASEVTSPASSPPPSSDQEGGEVITAGAAMALGTSPAAGPIFQRGSVVKIDAMPGVGLVDCAGATPGQFVVNKVDACGVVPWIVAAKDLQPAVVFQVCKIVLPGCARVWAVHSPVWSVHHPRHEQLGAGGWHLVAADDIACENVALCPMCKFIAKGGEKWTWSVPK